MVLWFPKTRRNKKYKLRLAEFLAKCESKLFDVFSCKCEPISSCSCEKSRKVPPQEQAFLEDQRTNRKMALGPVDVKETGRILKLEERKQKTTNRITSFTFPKTRRNKKYELRLAEFLAKCESKLFDVFSCKCEPISSCSCEKSRKVPPKEQAFLEDQRTNRKMALGPVDVKETERILKLEERKQKTTNRITSFTSVIDREKSTLSTTLKRKGPSFDGVVKDDPSSVSSRVHYLC
ncbi:unnamed protein product [Psylliodes chrysocephalus]|uniref:Uncharacterized protein n=1 Tax=Psylliodes chrysocephalus TaxID=3402493 RepID=A0A9P0D8G5_9CUCU|nr:unnamed protein product [Psylliodes chrysocephala]